MKKLLTLFSAFVLGSGSVFGMASCRTRVKHNIDDEEVNANKDLEILNQIKDEVRQTLNAWNERKTIIDINDYPEKVLWFQELVSSLETKDENLTLTREEIMEYSILEQLLTGFKAEFVNLNHSLQQDRYLNYYVDTMPLFLDEDDISFTLYNINFAEIIKLIETTPQKVKGIRVVFQVHYKLRFKSMEIMDYFYGGLSITDDLKVANNLGASLRELFTIFLDTLFKKDNYVVTVNPSSNNPKDLFNLIVNSIRNKIQKKLVDKNIPSSANNIVLALNVPPLNHSSSTLTWMGEGYHPEQLTKENFLQYYKKHYVLGPNNEYFYYSDVGFIPGKFVIYNLGMPNPWTRLKLKIKVWIPVNFVSISRYFSDFAKIILDFWRYYKIETYDDKHHCLVFKVNQSFFDKLVKNISDLNSKETKSLLPITAVISDFFKDDKLDSKDKSNFLLTSGLVRNIKLNIIKKEQNSIIIGLFDEGGNTFLFEYLFLKYLDLLSYSFFFKFDGGEHSFLQIIEFKVE